VKATTSELRFKELFDNIAGDGGRACGSAVVSDRYDL